MFAYYIMLSSVNVSRYNSQMIESQLERLKQDSVELDYYIQRLQKEGDTKKVVSIQKKRQYLLDYIETLQGGQREEILIAI